MDFEALERIKKSIMLLSEIILGKKTSSSKGGGKTGQEIDLNNTWRIKERSYRRAERSDSESRDQKGLINRGKEYL